MVSFQEYTVGLPLKNKWTVLYLDCSAGYTGISIYQSHQTVRLKCTHFAVIKSHLKVYCFEKSIYFTTFTAKRRKLYIILRESENHLVKLVRFTHDLKTLEIEGDFQNLIEYYTKPTANSIHRLGITESFFLETGEKKKILSPRLLNMILEILPSAIREEK